MSMLQMRLCKEQLRNLRQAQLPDMDMVDHKYIKMA